MLSGGDERFDDYFDRLSQVTSRYKRVLMLGDSMGASAALLFSPLATAVQAFSPQVRPVDFMPHKGYLVCSPVYKVH